MHYGRVSTLSHVRVGHAYIVDGDVPLRMVVV